LKARSGAYSGGESLKGAPLRSAPALLGNIILGWKSMARAKHSSLFSLFVNDEEKNIV